jgi:hypothetical protein
MDLTGTFCMSSSLRSCTFLGRQQAFLLHQLGVDDLLLAQFAVFLLQRRQREVFGRIGDRRGTMATVWNG